MRTFSDFDPNEPQERDPISYAPRHNDRPEVFEKHEPNRGGAARAIATAGGVLMLLWLVASMALWAFGYSPRILISGIVAGTAGLLIIAFALAADPRQRH